MNEVYFSMGSLVGKKNDYDTTQVARTAPSLLEEGCIDGVEFMFIKLYYGNGPEVARMLLSEGCVFPTFHTDKDIGADLSDAGIALKGGDRETAKKLRAGALDKFRYNCETACEAKSDRLVLHLWGGQNSDFAIDFNVDALPELIEISKEYGKKIIVENVPSSDTDPLTNWKKIARHFGDVGLVFDTRFATCHRNAKETLEDAAVFPYIEHIHISDYIGDKKDFKCLRPVYHPGEGICDFGYIFGRLGETGYGGTFTLESRGMTGDGPEIDVERIKKSLDFIKNSICRG